MTFLDSRKMIHCFICLSVFTANLHAMVGLWKDAPPCRFEIVDSTRIIESTSRPSLNICRISGEIGCGVISGIILGTVSYSMCKIGKQPEYSNVLPLFLGYYMGSALGVHFIGEMGDQSGSLFMTFTGGLVGIIAGSLINPVYGFYGAPLGATIGFNLTRRFDHPHATQNALLEIKSRDIKLNVPFIYPAVCDPCTGISADVQIVLMTFEF